MIRPLRKRHFQIWTTLAILLPIGIVSGWLAVHRPVYGNLLPSQHTPLPVVLRSIDRGEYSIQLRSNPDSSSLQLEWVNKVSWNAPSALLYQKQQADTSSQPGRGDLIGRIGSRGSYYFPLKNSFNHAEIHLMVYDIIHHRLIERINF